MTREEAIKVLQKHLEHWKRLVREHIADKVEGESVINALDLAIEALKSQPESEDA